MLIAGGGVAAAEALLALRALAGERASLTVLARRDELVLPALTVAEPFALGHATHHPLADLVNQTAAEHVRGALAGVDHPRREVRLQDGRSLAYDALVIAVGAQPFASVEHASTWWPHDNRGAFGGLLRDLEEGYTKRVAFVVPPDPAWPLPAYELALMTSHEARSMNINDAQLAIITPEAVPLGFFGADAAIALRQELNAADIRIEAATVPRIEPGSPITVVLQPSVHRLEVDRVIAIPGLRGPAIPGTTVTQAGFIRIDAGYRMPGAENVWAVGDAIAYPIKFGGLATQQADIVAAELARLAGADPEPVPSPRLQGVLLTGAEPRPLGRSVSSSPSAPPLLWQAHEKTSGRHLTPYLVAGHERSADTPPGGIAVDQPAPAADAGTSDPSPPATLS